MLKFKGTPPPLDSFLEDKPKNSQLKALQKDFFASLRNCSSCICISNNKLPSFHFPGPDLYESLTKYPIGYQ
ncbi:unnamed protein product [Sphagnum balticum]